MYGAGSCRDQIAATKLCTYTHIASAFMAVMSVGVAFAEVSCMTCSVLSLS